MTFRDAASLGHAGAFYARYARAFIESGSPGKRSAGSATASNAPCSSLTLVVRLKQASNRDLPEISIPRLHDRLRKRLRRAGIFRVIGGTEASYNELDGCRPRIPICCCLAPIQLRSPTSRRSARKMALVAPSANPRKLTIRSNKSPTSRSLAPFVELAPSTLAGEGGHIQCSQHKSPRLRAGRIAAWRKRDEARLRKWLSACRDHFRRQAKRLIVSDQRDLARL